MIVEQGKVNESDMSDKKFIGNNIKRVRKERKMTQSDLANECFISNTVISAYENGKKMPNLDTLANIARALKVSIDSLYYGSEEEAIIKRPSKRGRKIVNCIQYLYNERQITRFYDKGSSKLQLSGYGGVYGRLFDQLSDFNKNKNMYSNPEVFLEMLIEGAANEIDKIEQDRIEMERNYQDGGLPFT